MALSMINLNMRIERYEGYIQIYRKLIEEHEADLRATESEGVRSIIEGYIKACKAKIEVTEEFIEELEDIRANI